MFGVVILTKMIWGGGGECIFMGKNVNNFGNMENIVK